MALSATAVRIGAETVPRTIFMLDVFAEARQADDPHHFVRGRGYPCVFGGCSGFFHPAGAPTGVVLCAPWGFEDLVIRKSWRLLAEAIAAADYPCLRFDYPGTGNSLGRMTDPVSIEDWIFSINAAADYMRRINGVRRFVFVGQRLGAALAVEAARRRGDVVGLHLIAPVVDGRAHARNLAAINPGGAGGEPLSVMGFAMSDALAESLQTLDLRRTDRLEAASITVYDRMDRREAAVAVEHLRGLGHDVGIETIVPPEPSGSDATIDEPLPISVDRVVARIVAAHPIILPSPTREPLLTSILAGADFREEPIRFGAGRSLFGILCHPLRPTDGGSAVILLDRAVGPNIGFGRCAVDLARGLAAAGIPSLRFDAAGIGESRDQPGRPQSFAYAEALLADVHDAVDALRLRGHTRIVLTGTDCGAYTALAAAHLDVRIKAVVAVDAQRFAWNPNEHVDEVVRFGHRSLADYLAMARKRDALGKLVRHRHHIVPALAFLAKRGTKILMSHVPRRLRSALRRGSSAARVAHLFALFAARGTRVSLVFGVGDPGLVELGSYFGPNGRDLRSPNVTLSIAPHIDGYLNSGWTLDHLIEAACDGAQGVPEAQRATLREL